MAEPSKTLASLQSKLLAAQKCHPAAVQTLISEALDTLDEIARAPQAVAAQAAPATVHTKLSADAGRLAYVADQIRALEPVGSEGDVFLTEVIQVLKDCAALAATPALPATEDSSAGDLADEADDEGISREDWLAQAERLYLAVGDTLDEARMCASYLYNEQDWDGFGGDDPIHAALDDVEGRGPQAEVQAEPVMIYHGRCTIDCGEHGHQDVEMLKMIPAGAKLYTAPQAQPADALDAETIKKAARYDWLRAAHDRDDGSVAIFIDDEQHGPGHLDSQVDAAMAAAQEGGNAAKEA